MKTAIVGAGAMGCLYGALLAKAGEEVWLIGRRREIVRVIEQRGVSLSHPDGSEERVRVRATTEVGQVGPADLVLFLVKSGDTAEAARAALPMVGAGTYAMTLQNGIGNGEAIERELGIDRVIYGMSLLGASFKGPGRVEVAVPKGTGVMVWIGAKKETEMLLGVAEVFNRAGIPTEVSHDIQRVIWTKLPLACAMGTVSALTRTRIGDLLAVEEGRELLRLVAVECVEVARRKGVDLKLDEVVDLLFATGRSISGHTSSMLQSFLDRKKTEIEALNQAVALEAEHLGIFAPVNRTLALLVRVIEKTYDRQLGPV
jgi:2-dehydropantoate 2-reductase